MEPSATPAPSAPLAPSWQLDELAAEILDALRSGGSGDGKVIDGRALAVKASPMRENSSKITVGTAALPPGFSTLPHSHDAEEVAIFLSGSGRVEIDGVPHPVRQGTVLLTPSGAGHVTISDPGAPLVVLWFYAPPGSEARWLEPDRHPTAGHAGSGDAAMNEAPGE
jgi:quercetin dioxygenase-like cupin family protein